MALAVLARSFSKFESAKMFWLESHKLAAEDSAERAKFVPCDLSDMTIVKKVGDGLMGKLERLDMLIDNAGEQLFVETLKQPTIIRRSSNYCRLHTFSSKYRDNLSN